MKSNLSRRAATAILLAFRRKQFADINTCPVCGKNRAQGIVLSDRELLEAKWLSSANAPNCLSCTWVKGRAAGHKRRAAMRENGGSFTQMDVAEMYSGQDGKCVYCSCSLESGFHIDHIQPVIKGGSSDKSNLQLLCAKCNLSKGPKTHEEFLAYLKKDVDSV